MWIASGGVEDEARNWCWDKLSSHLPPIPRGLPDKTEKWISILPPHSLSLSLSLSFYNIQNVYISSNDMPQAKANFPLLILCTRRLMQWKSTWGPQTEQEVRGIFCPQLGLSLSTLLPIDIGDKRNSMAGRMSSTLFLSCHLWLWDEEKWTIHAVQLTVRFLPPRHFRRAVGLFVQLIISSCVTARANPLISQFPFLEITSPAQWTPRNWLLRW